jgi:hypothetical protein
MEDPSLSENRLAHHISNQCTVSGTVNACPHFLYANLTTPQLRPKFPPHNSITTASLQSAEVRFRSMSLRMNCPAGAAESIQKQGTRPPPEATTAATAATTTAAGDSGS